MKVRDIIEHDTFCEMLEVIIREEGYGQWIQGYRIGKDAYIPPSDRIRRDTWTPLEEGEEVDYKANFTLPCRVIKKHPTKAPDYVLDLEVCSFTPYFVPHIWGDRTSSLNHMISVCSYPDDFTKSDLKKIVKENAAEYEDEDGSSEYGQMTLF